MSPATISSYMEEENMMTKMIGKSNPSLCLACFYTFNTANESLPATILYTPPPTHPPNHSYTPTVPRVYLCCCANCMYCFCIKGEIRLHSVFMLYTCVCVALAMSPKYPHLCKTCQWLVPHSGHNFFLYYFIL